MDLGGHSTYANTDERSSVTSIWLRLLAITDIAFWQKISGTKKLGEAKGETVRVGK